MPKKNEEGNYQELWELLEEIDAQLDLEEEISSEFADKVHFALWGEKREQKW